MKKLNPYDLSGMRRAAERAKSAPTRTIVQKCNCADLLFLADQLTEAARQYHIATNSPDYTQEQCRKLHIALGAKLAAWDAARKGR